VVVHHDSGPGSNSWTFLPARTTVPAISWPKIRGAGRDRDSIFLMSVAHHAACPDADQYFAFANPGNRDLTQLDPVAALVDRCLHHRRHRGRIGVFVDSHGLSLIHTPVVPNAFYTASGRRFEIRSVAEAGCHS